MIENDGKLYLVATGGDAWVVCRVNCDFFEGKVDGNVLLLRITKTSVDVITNLELREMLKTKVPSFCICACRPSGDGDGPIKAMHYYEEKRWKEYANMIWIQFGIGLLRRKQSDINAGHLYKLIMETNEQQQIIER